MVNYIIIFVGSILISALLVVGIFYWRLGAYTISGHFIAFAVLITATIACLISGFTVIGVGIGTIGCLLAMPFVRAAYIALFDPEISKYTEQQSISRLQALKEAYPTEIPGHIRRESFAHIIRIAWLGQSRINREYR